jgi:hypothetical protein
MVYKKYRNYLMQSILKSVIIYVVIISCSYTGQCDLKNKFTGQKQVLVVNRCRMLTFPFNMNEDGNSSTKELLLNLSMR